MKLDLTKDQYLSLLKALSVASWVSSAVIDSEEDVEVDFEPLEQYVMSKHSEFGVSDGEEVFFDKDTNLYFPTQDFEDEIMPVIDLFEDTSFWEELTHRLARRDLLEKHGEKVIEEMDPLARLGLEEEHLIKYSEEFSQFGVHRLRVIGD
jgi:hypothetical protein